MSNAFERNKNPILAVLKQLLSSNCRKFILEIASGYGHHVRFFAQHFDNIIWQLSDYDKSCVSYLQNTVKKIDPSNFKMLRPIFLDASEDPNMWLQNCSGKCFDAVLCINMTHISKWEATKGLFKGSSFYLKSGGALIIYGPFIVYGDFVHENNIRFDEYLKSQNAEWGIREVSELCKVGDDANLTLEKIIDMPANNKILLFRKH